MSKSKTAEYTIDAGDLGDLVLDVFYEFVKGDKPTSNDPYAGDEITIKYVYISKMYSMYNIESLLPEKTKNNIREHIMYVERNQTV